MDKDALQECGLFLFDMDGTLYLGEAALPGAIAFMQKLDSAGKKYRYLTNNSSRAGVDYVERLRRLGFPCADGDVYTSGMAAAELIGCKWPDATLYCAGTQALLDELRRYGVRLTQDMPDIVLIGFDRELDYEKLVLASRYLRRGAKFLATNPDLVCPMPGEYDDLPDCGSICALLTSATGCVPQYIGKPSRSMVDALAERCGVQNQNCAVIGDRLYTDIAAAVNAGAVSVLVLSGETKRESLEASPVKPDYVFDSVVDLGGYLNLG